MQDELNILNSLLSDLSNFSLVFFGFSISLFTLLYSFISTRRDSLKEYSEQVKLGDKDPRLTQRINNAVAFIKNMRKISFHFICTIFLEIVIYVICVIAKYGINTLNVKKNFVTVTSISTVIVFIYVIILLSFVIKDFSTNTKI